MGRGEFSADFAATKKWKLDAGLWVAIQGALPPPPTTVIDLGAGIGRYVQALLDAGYQAAGLDGIEGVEHLSGGVVLQANLAEPVTYTRRADWAMSFEVGEHLPAIHAGQYLDNVANAATEGIIMSWAYLGQRGRGHINCRPQEYVIEQIQARQRWTLDHQATAKAKQQAGKGWDRKLLVFRRWDP